MNPLLAKLSSAEARAVRDRGRLQVLYELVEVLRKGRHLGPESARLVADLYYGLEYLRDNLPPIYTWRVSKMDGTPRVVAGFLVEAQAEEYASMFQELYPENRYGISRGPVSICLVIRPGFAAADYAKFLPCQ